jgi:transposase-like protein
MSGDVTKLRPKQEAALVALLSNRNVEDAARAVKVAPRTLYRWLNGPEFDNAYRRARRAAYGQATARLHQASGAAVSAVLKIMVDSSAPASTRLRAGDIVLGHTAKAIEIEDIDARVAALERAIEESTQRR